MVVVPLLSRREAVGLCLIMSVAYVGCLYVLPHSIRCLPRDNILHIKARSFAVVVTSALCVALFGSIVSLRSSSVVCGQQWPTWLWLLGVRAELSMMSSNVGGVWGWLFLYMVCPLLLISTLYLGVLVAVFLLAVTLAQHQRGRRGFYAVGELRSGTRVTGTSSGNLSTAEFLRDGLFPAVQGKLYGIIAPVDSWWVVESSRSGARSKSSIGGNGTFIGGGGVGRVFTVRPEERWVALRNLMFGPVFEEIVFRGCMIPLLLYCGDSSTLNSSASTFRDMGNGYMDGLTHQDVERWSMRSVVFLSPVIFGVAHVHHFFERYGHGVPLIQNLVGGEFAGRSLFIYYPTVCLSIMLCIYISAI